jgi:Ca2+-binding RTX toxin-like protein
VVVNGYFSDINSRVNSIEFSDGTVWSTSNLLFGSNTADTLTATATSNIIVGLGGNDTLVGSDTVDYLYGGSENDTITGGRGNDVLVGGTGTDTYVFNIADGQDTYSLSGTEDRLKIGEGIAIENLKGTMDVNGSYMLSVGADTLTFKNWVDGNKLASLTLFDGTVLNTEQIELLRYTDIIGTIGNDSLKGSSTKDVTERLLGLGGNDSLYGYGGDDILDGGTGTDRLEGGTGNDTYIFNAGYGTDTIYDNDATVGNQDTILIGEGLLASDAQVSVQNTDLIISFASTGDRLIIQNYLSSNENYRIETISFADGTQWTYDTVSAMNLSNTGTSANNSMAGTSVDNVMWGLEGNDSLYGYGGNDTLDGGVGNDYLNGGTGNDTYIFNAGYGTDTIYDCDSTAGNQDTILIGAGLEASNAVVGINGTSLEISFTGTEDKLIIKDYLYSSGNGRVETLKFADGTVWDKTTLDALTLNNTGTEAANTILGTDGRNTLSGLGGDDRLYGYGGDDILDGGTGTDRLEGGTGNDTYIFNAGFGQDTIYNVTSSPMDYDKAVFYYDSSKLIFSRVVNDLNVQIAGQTDTVLIQSWYSNANGRLEEIDTNEGNRLIGTEVDQLIQAMATFATQTGLTWEQASQQNNQQYTELLATYYHQ